MRKLILLLIIFISSFQSYSQTKLGVKSGLVASTVIAKKFIRQADYEDFEHPKLGYYGGVYTTMILGDKYCFRPELLFSLKGYKTTSSDTLWDARKNRRLYYLNLPLLISYKYSERLTLMTGPELGLLLRAEGKHTIYAGNSGDFKTIEGGFERGDYGIALGFNYRLMAKLSFDLRYSLGFNKLTQRWGISDTRNKALQGGLAYNLF
ncbi:MAG: porin family protein [Adhaeribacter sp.]